MRLRNIKGARDVLAESPFVVKHETEKKGNWKQEFEKEQPLYVEIGMGKGRFLMDQAAAHPEINFVGVEMYASVLLRAVQKMEELQYPNVRFLNVQAEGLEEIFAPGEIDKIYLNFSDPWPKARHARRRLTSPQFLARYEKILKKDGILEFKTDNQDLFTFSLESVPEAGWELLYETRDLHHDPVLSEGNIMTEYEQKFSEKGQPICKLAARQKQNGSGKP